MNRRAGSDVTCFYAYYLKYEQEARKIEGINKSRVNTFRDVIPNFM